MKKSKLIEEDTDSLFEEKESKSEFEDDDLGEEFLKPEYIRSNGDELIEEELNTEENMPIGWKIAKDKIISAKKEFEFDDFEEAAVFTVKIARIARGLSSPEVTISNNLVTIEIHSAELGFSTEEFNLINAIDNLF